MFNFCFHREITKWWLPHVCESRSLVCFQVHTIYLRTKRRLAELKEELEAALGGVECSLQGSPVILSVPVLVPCLRAEHLLITVDTHTGMLQCHVPQYDPPLLPELQTALNTDRAKVPGLLTELRYSRWLDNSDLSIHMANPFRLHKGVWGTKMANDHNIDRVRVIQSLADDT